MNLDQWFERFLSPRADRSGEIALILEERGVAARVIDMAGGRFVVAWPRRSVRDARYRFKVVTAHHDRVPGTPGALDNSAACLQLVDFVSSRQETFNTLAVFTDREELGHSIGSSAPSAWPVDQGSYSLGKALIGNLIAGMGSRTPMVFPLDVTGRGDCIILSKAADGLLSRQDEAGIGPPRAALSALVAETDSMADIVSRMMAGRSPVFRAAVPFGEDLGFICSGVPALTVTVLPKAEAETLSDRGRIPAWASTSAPGDRMPETWKRLHGPDDTPELFTSDAFEAIGRFLARLGALRVPAAIVANKKP